jgi:hypothetical protein
MVIDCCVKEAAGVVTGEVVELLDLEQAIMDNNIIKQITLLMTQAYILNP